VGWEDCGDAVRRLWRYGEIRGDGRIAEEGKIGEDGGGDDLAWTGMREGEEIFEIFEIFAGFGGTYVWMCGAGDACGEGAWDGCGRTRDAARLSLFLAVAGCGERLRAIESCCSRF
jgi:hypothetical protein